MGSYEFNEPLRISEMSSITFLLLSYLLLVRKDPVSILGPKADYPECSCGYPKCLDANDEVLSHYWQRHLTNSFQVIIS